MDFFIQKRFTVVVLSILVILNLFLLGILWYTQFHKSLPAPPPPDQGPRDTAAFMERELNFTAEQRKEFQEIKAEHLRRSNEVRAEVQRLKEQILNEALSPSPDTLKVKSLAREIGEKEAEFEEYLFRHFTALKSVCTMEQLEKLQQLFDEMLEKNRLPAPPGAERRPPPPRHEP